MGFFRFALLLFTLAVGESVLGFAYLNWELIQKEGFGETQRIASFWKTALTNGGVDVNVFPLAGGAIAFATNTTIREVKQFVLSQDDLVDL